MYIYDIYDDMNDVCIYDIWNAIKTRTLHQTIEKTIKVENLCTLCSVSPVV